MSVISGFACHIAPKTWRNIKKVIRAWLLIDSVRGQL